MKKNFFKKLSFVMALAMLISVVAPAASAFAATSPALNATGKTLLLGNEDRSEYDFNVKNKQKGWSYKWTSSKTSVAKVDAKNGFTTAVGIGTATIKVVITKSGKTVKTLSATVTVKDNIKTITAINAPAGADVAKLAVDTAYDFGRSFKTESGSTTKTTAITRWIVSSSDATIDANGVFKASKAGKYTITAVAFQSKAKFGAWDGKDLNSKLVLASKALEVTVANSIKEVKQLDPKKFTVTFDADMSKTDLSKDKAAVYQVINGKDVSTGSTKINKLTLDATGKVATVELFADVATNSTYKFVYGTLTGTFTSPKNELSEVANVVFNDFSVSNSISNSMLKKVALVDKNGVVIAYGDGKIAGINASSYLTFEYTGDNTKASIAGSDIYVYSMDYAAPVTVKFNAYIFDAAASKYTNVTYTDTALVTKTTAAAEVMSSAEFKLFDAQSFMGLSNSSVWGGGKSAVAKGESLKIGARFIPANATDYTYDKGTTRFYYKSSNDAIALVTGNDIWGVTEGTVAIVVYDNDYKVTYGSEKVIGTFDVTVAPKRTLASVSQDLQSVVISNNTTVNESVLVTLTVKDSLSDAAALNDAAKYSITPSWEGTSLALPTISTGSGKVAGNKKGEAYVSINLPGATAGTYQLKLAIKDIDNDIVRYAVVYVTVLEGTGSVSYWRLETNKSSVDLKDDYNETVTVALYGYNNYNAKCAVKAAGDYTLTVVNSSTRENTLTTYGPNFAYTTTSIPVITVSGTSASGSAVKSYEKGSYTLTADDGTNKYSAPLTVVDSTNFTCTLDKYSVNPTTKTILEAVKEAYTFRKNYMPKGEGLTGLQVDGILEIKYSDGTVKTTGTTDSYTAGKSINIISIKYRVYEDGSAPRTKTTKYIDYTFKPGDSITVY